MAKTKSDERLCGCYIANRQIVFCEMHGKAHTMAGMLNVLRKYFLETTGEESPFVKKIDELIPRPRS